jgi:hypothetical protein
MLINAAVIVALGAGMVAYKYIAGDRRAPASEDEQGSNRTRLLVKLIIAGLVMLLGLGAYFLFARGGG